MTDELAGIKRAVEIGRDHRRKFADVDDDQLACGRCGTAHDTVRAQLACCADELDDQGGEPA